MRQRTRARGGLGVIILLILVIVLGIIAAFLFTGNSADRNAGQNPGGEQQNQPQEPNQGQAPEQLEASVQGGEGSVAKNPQVGDEATFGGVTCVLTELGEDAIHRGEQILVNNWTEYVFPEEADLVNVYNEKTRTYYVKDTTVDVGPVTMEALNDLMDAFAAQGGSKTVMVISGYRTSDFQQHLFDQSVERNGKEHADRYVAQPGGSEHHTGYAIDFQIYHAGDGTCYEYDGTGEYAWINSHCQDYGFIVRYDQAKADLTGIYYEPWHFRYLGVPHATKVVELGLCLEEYIDHLKDFTFEGEHLKIQCAQGDYEAWYCEGTQAWLPQEGEYTVSGNNVDGFIVTYKVS